MLGQVVTAYRGHRHKDPAVAEERSAAQGERDQEHKRSGADSERLRCSAARAPSAGLQIGLTGRTCRSRPLATADMPDHTPHQ